MESTVTMKVELYKQRDQAGAILKQMSDKNTTKLMYVCKVIDTDSTQYKKSTPTDVMYLNMSRYISGESVNKDKKKTAKHFVEVAELDMESLKLRAMIKDAGAYKFIAPRGDSNIYESETGIALGKNPKQVFEYLKNPVNEEVYKRLLAKLEHYWKQ